MYICIRIYVPRYVSPNPLPRTHEHIYICIYIYKYIYIYVYIYIYIQTEKDRERRLVGVVAVDHRARPEDPARLSQRLFRGK